MAGKPGVDVYKSEPVIPAACGFQFALDNATAGQRKLPGSLFTHAELPEPSSEKEKTLHGFLALYFKNHSNRLTKSTERILNGNTLTENEAAECMEDLMTGNFTSWSIGLLLGALETRPPRVEELTAFAGTMRKHAHHVRPKITEKLCDTCGTGGDVQKTFNVSTAVIFILAAAGIPVAKHGNRSITSMCGSADLLESAGANLNKTPEQVEDSIKKTGIGFMFAPLFHPAMHHVMPARKEIAKPTVFNRLGPLVNPAEPQMQILGVYDPDFTEIFAKVLRNLGTERAMVVHGYNENDDPALDEVSISGKTQISSLKPDGTIYNFVIEPADISLTPVPLKELKGHTAIKNAEILRKVLSGSASASLMKFTLVNAAMGLWMAGKSEDLEEGIKIAREMIATGKSLKKLDDFIDFSTNPKIS